MTNPKTLKDKILLGIDYGETNIGLAFGRNGLASPLSIISGKDASTAVNEIMRTAIENRVDQIIIGLPLTYDNKETNQSKKVRTFVKILKIYFKKPVQFVNEYDSSNDSFDESVSIGVPKKKRRKVDNYSAALIIKKFYEENDLY